MDKDQKRRKLTAEEAQEAERLMVAWEKYKKENKGATQTWLASVTKIGTQSAVGQYLRGYIPLNIEALSSICKAINANPYEISPRLMKSIEPIVKHKDSSDVHNIRTSDWIFTSVSREQYEQLPLIKKEEIDRFAGFVYYQYMEKIKKVS